MLDTDVSRYLIKGRRDDFRAHLADIGHRRLCVSVVTRAELMFGVVRLPPEHRLHLGVRQFLKVTSVLPWPEQAADRYASIRHDLERAGTPIGQLDMMIAAHALAIDAVLVTNNVRHFERVGPMLQIRAWSAG